MKRSAASGRNQILLLLVLLLGIRIEQEQEQEHEQEGLSAADAQKSSQKNKTFDVNCVRKKAAASSYVLRITPPQN